jgi:hypothetical protein
MRHFFSQYQIISFSPPKIRSGFSILIVQLRTKARFGVATKQRWPKAQRKTSRSPNDPNGEVRLAVSWFNSSKQLWHFLIRSHPSRFVEPLKGSGLYALS